MECACWIRHCLIVTQLFKCQPLHVHYMRLLCQFSDHLDIGGSFPILHMSKISKTIDLRWMMVAVNVCLEKGSRGASNISSVHLPSIQYEIDVSSSCLFRAKHEIFVRIFQVHKICVDRWSEPWYEDLAVTISSVWLNYNKMNAWIEDHVALVWL